MLGISDPVALNYYTLFCLIPLTLFVSRNLTLIYLPLSGFLDSLLCNLIAPTPGLEFFLLMPHTLAAASFSSGRVLSFSELFTSYLSLLHPYSDYVEVNISLNDSSSLSFLNVYASPIRSSPRDSRTDSFSPSILPIFRNLSILGDCNYHRPLWDSKGTSDSRGEEVFDCVISDLLNDSGVLTFLKNSSGSCSSPGLSFAPFFLASGRCFRTWVVINYQFYKPSLFLRSFASANVPLPSIFRKLVGMALPITLTPTVLLERSTRLFLFPLLLFSLLLCH